MRAAVVVTLAVALVATCGCGRRMERALQEKLEGDPLAGYRGGHDPERMDAGPLPALDESVLGRPLVVVLPAYYASEINVGAAVELQRLLSERVGIPVVIRSADAYGHEALVRGLSDGTVDVADVAPYTFAVLEQRRIGAVPIVATVSHGSSSYGSYLVVRRGSPIQTLEDLRGKRLALVDPLSTSGYLLPIHLLRRHGFDPERDLVVSYAGTHPKAVEQVRDGVVDAAAVSSDLLIGNSGLAGPLRVIAKAGRIPHDVIVARHDLDPAIVARLRVTLLGLSIHDERSRAALKAFSAVDAFMPVPPGHYDEVLKLARDLVAAPSAP